MTIFDLTIGRIIYLIETINKILFGASIEILKSFALFFSLLISSLLIYYWFRLELKEKDEIGFWQSLADNKKDYQFIKESKKIFNKIKEIFYQNKIQGLIKINNFLDRVLVSFGYEGDLEEKLDKIHQEFLPNKEEIKKARKALILIDQKIKSGEKIDLSDEDYLIIFHEYEKGLFHLNVITEEDFLVKNQEQEK